MYRATASSRQATDAITATLAAYELSESESRFADLAATFLSGGVLECGGRLLRGRSAIQVDFERLRSRPRVAGSPNGPGTVVRHLTSSHIEFVGPTEAHCYSRFVVTSPTSADHSGQYLDVLRLVGTSWLIAHRKVTVDSAVATSAMRAAVRRQRRPAGPLVARPAVAGPSVVGRSRQRSAG